MSSAQVPHSILVFYGMLQSEEPAEIPVYIREWERDLQHNFSETQLDHLYCTSYTSSVDTKMQENSFKLLTRWYQIPSGLARIYPFLSDACWRDCGHRGTFLHIWWECPKLRPYWQDRAQIRTILDIDLLDLSLQFLLHVPSILLGYYRKYVLPHLLNAAQWLIPIYLKKTQFPCRAQWITLVNNIMEAEEWMATCKGRHSKFYAVWATWIHYSSGSLAASQPTTPMPVESQGMGV